MGNGDEFEQTGSLSFLVADGRYVLSSLCELRLQPTLTLQLTMPNQRIPHQAELDRQRIAI